MAADFGDGETLYFPSPEPLELPEVEALGFDGGELIGVVGPPGPAGGRILVTAGENLPRLTTVWIAPDALAYAVTSADREAAEAAVGVLEVGLVARETGAAVADGDLHVGVLPVGPLFVGLDGSPTPDPSTGVVEIEIGYAPTPTRLVVRLGRPVHRP